MRASYILALGALAATTTAVELSDPNAPIFDENDHISQTLEDLQSLLDTDKLLMSSDDMRND